MPVSNEKRPLTHKPRAIADGAEHPVRDESARAAWRTGGHPIIGMLQRLSEADVIDDLAAELATLDAADKTEFLAAIDTLRRLASRIELTAMQDQTAFDFPSRSILSSEHVDISIEDMAAMLVELMTLHESSTGYDAVSQPNWRSPGGRCEVCKSGQSAALLWSLQQDPEAVFAEYRICLDGEEVWSWSDKVWPDLSAKSASSALVRIPTLCFDAIIHHLEQHNAEWVERWRDGEDKMRMASDSGA